MTLRLVARLAQGQVIQRGYLMFVDRPSMSRKVVLGDKDSSREDSEENKSKGLA